MAVTKDSTAVGVGGSLSVKHKDSFSYSVAGTFVGTVVIEKSQNLQAWETVVTATGAATGTVPVFTSDQGSMNYRFRCSAFTSGTIETSLSEVSNVVQAFKNNAGEDVLKIKEDGVEVVGSFTSSGAAVSSLADGKIFVGNSSNLAAAVTPIRDVTITNAGVTAIGSLKVATAMIQANAVTLAKLASGVTPSHVVKFAGKFTTVGGDANEQASVAGVVATDIVIASLQDKGASPVTLLTSKPGTDVIDFVMSADPSTGSCDFVSSLKGCKLMKEALVKNAADKDQIRQAKHKERWSKENQVADMLWIISDVRGRRVLWRYLEDCGVFRSSFTGNSTTFFNEGMRNSGLKLLAEITEASPELYMTMMKEAKAREDMGKKEVDESSDD